jgi:hypothetical protein
VPEARVIEEGAGALAGFDLRVLAQRRRSPHGLDRLGLRVAASSSGNRVGPAMPLGSRARASRRPVSSCTSTS